MTAIDLTSPSQRRFALTIAAAYPLLWLFGIGRVERSPLVSPWALVPAFVLFVPSAIGAWTTIRARGDVAHPPGRLRMGLYLSWAWLVPCCAITSGAIFAFQSLWAPYAVLILPALLFLVWPTARERFLLVALASLALAGLLIGVEFAAGLVWKTKLALAMALSAAPFWSLAASLCLAQHLVRAPYEGRAARREGRLALVWGLVGIALFFVLVAVLALIAVAGLQ